MMKTKQIKVKYKMRAMCLWISLVLIFTGIYNVNAATIALPTTRVYNGDFESGTDPSTISGWTKENTATNFTAQTQTSIVRNGSKALQFQFTNYNGGTTGGVYSWLPYTIDANTDYYFECWMKSDLVTNGKKPYALIALSKPSYTAYNCPEVGLTQDWTKYSTTFNSGVNNLANNIRIRILRSADSANPINGSIYVDDCLVVKMPTSLTFNTPATSYYTTDTVNLGTAIAVTANYGTDSANIPANDNHLLWSVVSGSATINNGILSYTGARAGGSVRLQAEYMGRNNTIDLTFAPEQPFYIDNMVFKHNSQDITTTGITSGDIVCSVNIENYTASTPISATMILGLYDGEKLEGFSQSEPVIVPGDGQPQLLTTTINVPNATGRKIKAFIWDSIEGMQPIQGFITFDNTGKH